MTPEEPLASSRARRTNAGAKMSQMIQAEEDDFYQSVYGGFDEEDDDEDFDEEQEEEDYSVDSDSDDDETDEILPEFQEEGEEKKKSSVSILSPIINSSQSKDVKQSIKPGSPSKSTYSFLAKLCSVCLTGQSDEDDEIIECDSCGVPVHESCYGVYDCDDDKTPINSTNIKSTPRKSPRKDKPVKKENDCDNNADIISIKSHSSDESTEPWFCEPCRKAKRHPYCQLCPNQGGIFKETDTGQWVHMVCALYTPGVTFEDVKNLKSISLFEINNSMWGSRICTICDDGRLAKTGICIECDAGLCKTFFHVTCAQKEGLLFESHLDEVDPYVAQCRQHADKTTIEKKKRTFLALHAKLKKIASEGRLYVEDERVKEKLKEFTSQPNPALNRWNDDNRPPIPKESSRMLLSSPSAILKLNKKSELAGIDTKSSFLSIQDEMDATTQKWHIPPAFDLQFVAYAIDRNTRMTRMNKQYSELTKQNITLKNQEVKLREKYEIIKSILDQLRAHTESEIEQIRNLQQSVSTKLGKPYSLPLILEQLIAKTLDTKKHKTLDKQINSHRKPQNVNKVKMNQLKDMNNASKSMPISKEDLEELSIPVKKLKTTSNASKQLLKEDKNSCVSNIQMTTGSKKSTPKANPASLLVHHQAHQVANEEKVEEHPIIETYDCEKCKTNQDQHMLSLCDTCHLWYHIYCLDPPLTRVPKKTKFGGWQCSDCSEKDDEDQEAAEEKAQELASFEKDGPRQLRERIKFPEKYSHESLMLANFYSQKRSKKKSKGGSKKKPKTAPSSSVKNDEASPTTVCLKIAWQG